MKAKIINQNYVYRAGREQLQPAIFADEKPWSVFGVAEFKAFPTHAEAIHYADSLVVALREVS